MLDRRTAPVSTAISRDLEHEYEYPRKNSRIVFKIKRLFLLPQFTLFDGTSHTHIDFLGLRSPGSVERCGEIIFPLDDTLFGCIDEIVSDSKNQLLALAAEVKGNKEKEKPGEGHNEYINNFLGHANRIDIFFRDQGDNISKDEDIIEVPLKHALNWLIERIKFINGAEIKLAKESSWTWSESSLSDILYLAKLGFLRKLE